MVNHSYVFILSRASNSRFLLKGNLLTHRWTKWNIQKNRFLSSRIRAGSYRNYEEENLSRQVTIPEKFNFASDVLDKWARKEREGLRNSSIPAFWYVSDDGAELKLNYQELEKESKKTANILQGHCGIKQGDNVIVMLPKIPEFWLVNVAALRIGFVSSPATMMLTVKDLAYRFSALKPSCVIAHESVADVVDEAAKSCSTLKDKVIVSASPNRRKGWHDLNRLQPEKEDHECAVTNSNDTMMIFFTSGTTGNPKMVEHSYASYGIGLNDVGKYWLDLTKDSIMYNMSDTGWAKTAYSSIFAPWSQGSCVFVHQMTRFSPLTTLEVLSRYPIDTLCAAPLVYRALVQEDLSKYKFNKLEHCVSGGDSLNVEVIKKWMAATGLKIYEGYGQSETAGIITMRKSFEFRIGSIGRSMPGMTVKIVDENENEVEPGVRGEMVLERKNATGLFKGYKDNPEQNKRILTEKYFHSGDLGHCDEDGYFWFVGRNDDLINSAGYRIGPNEVENALMEHPAVVEVAVISSPDPERGEVVKAIIVLNNSAEPSEELVKELQEHCKRVTAPYKYPRKIEFIKEFPKTVSGKIKRFELKQKELKKL